MPNTITLSGNYGYRDYYLRNGDADVINASSASWTLANMGSTTNRYPFRVDGNDPALRIIGGTINGQISQTMDWERLYVNSAAVMVGNVPQATIEDWRITRAWDAIRLGGNSNGFTIEDVWASDVRDDAIENDFQQGGTIRDSLFDNVFSGISTVGSGGSGRTITLDGVLMRMKSYLYDGKVTHASPFKADSDGPRYEVHDSIIAIERVDHLGRERLEGAFDRMAEVTNSYFLNLSDQALPRWYPDIPDGFRYLQGNAARDFWADARADWVAEHGSGGSSSSSSLPSINTIVGTENSQTMTGTAAADSISGRGGNDRLLGKGGSDILSGGSGRDSFVFDTGPGTSNMDRITDFLPGTDRIFLDNSVFAKLGAGSLSSPRVLSASFFESDGTADDSNDFVIYDRSTGALFYDSNGSASGGSVKVAQIGAGLNLQYDDVFVV
jgi:Ca2+-binding RTX toxin-like protein